MSTLGLCHWICNSKWRLLLSNLNFLIIILVTTKNSQCSVIERSPNLFPPPWIVTFQRDAVESPPQISHSSSLRIASYTENFEFGDKSLPLRAAVESFPETASFRVPLRDAVERRPPPDSTYRDSVLEEISTDKQPWEFFSYYTQFSQYTPNYSPFLYYLTKRSGNIQELMSKLNAYYPVLPIQNIVKTDQKEHLFCYVQNSASHRKEPLVFTPRNIDPYMCTHIIYSFATIDPHTFGLAARDYEYDIVRGGYRACTGLKRQNPELKVLLSVGGVRESGNKFSDMVLSAKRREKFIQTAIDLLVQYNFDGLDIHWQYPAFVEFGGRLQDKENLVRLIKEINERFHQMTSVLGSKMLLTIGVPAVRYKLNDGYDFSKITALVDFVILQPYDFNYERPNVADHHSPLYRRDHDYGSNIFYNMEYSVQYILKTGVPRSKLIVSLPLYGRSFTLLYSNVTEPGAPAKGPGLEGYYTQTPGFLAYFEICDLFENKNIVKSRDSSGSPYLINGNQWIGYEDQESLTNKILFSKELDIAGVAVWSMDHDDFQGLCGNKYPLMNAVRKVLKGIKETIGVLPIEPTEILPVQPVGQCGLDGLYNDPLNCARYYLCQGGLAYHLSCKNNTLFDLKSGKCTSEMVDRCYPGQYRQVLGNSRKEKKIVCYLTNWSFYRKAEGKFVPEHLDSRLCTHIVYAFASLEPEQLIIKEFDPWADIDNDLYNRVTSIRDAHVLLALGGWTDSSGDKYSRLVSDGSSRRKFVASVISFLRKHNFQGLHLDWNYPKCWQSNCKKGPASDRPNFTKLIQELRKEFNKQSPPLILAAAISGYKEIIDVAYELAPLGQALDFMSVMTYDYHGSWEQETGHVSPLYGRPNDKYPQYNTNFTMEYLVSQGAPREKLLLGIPFYGQSFTLAKHDYSIGAKAAGPGEAGEFTKQPGMLAYFEICNRIRNNRWQVSKDPSGLSGPYAYSGNQWVGFEDPSSIAAKTQYIKDHNFGGAVAWTVDIDDFLNRCCLEPFPLLKAINRGLGRLNDPPPTAGDCTKPPEPITPPAPTLTTGVDTGAASTTPMHHHEHTTTQKTTTWPSWTQSSTTQSTTTSPWWTTTTTTMKPSTMSTTTTRRTTTYKTTTTRKTTTTKKPTTTQKPTSTTLPTPAVIRPEVDDQKPPLRPCETGQYLPDPQNCNAYYRCILGEMKKQYCAGGLHWNRNTQVCDWPSVAKCKETSYYPTKPTTKRPTTTQSIYWTTMKPTTTRRTTTTHRYTTPKKPTTSRPVYSTQSPKECNTGEYYPHEDCNHFYVCVNGILISQSCGPGLVWSQESSMCDWKFKVQCSSTAKNEISRKPKPTASLTVKAHPEGSCDSGTFAPYSADCNQYLMCLWGKYQLFSCAPGLSWNNERKICDWPTYAKCEADEPIGVIPIKPVTTTYKPTTTTRKSTTYKPTTTTRKSTTYHPTYTTTTYYPIKQTEKPTTTTVSAPEEVRPPYRGKYKIVCYFTNWAWYRRGIGKYLPENINPNLCTHIVYGFAVLDYENLIIKAHDSWADFDNKFYQRVTAYKAKGLKVTLAIGGWNDSAGDKYSRLVNNPAARARFIKHVIAFLEKHNFDGLDLDWEYPKCWQVDCKKGPDSDKPAFAAFLRELRAAFSPKGLLLSAAVSPSKTVIDAGYDVPALAKNLDWVAVMTYDFHGQWDKQTGHVAPLYYHPDDTVSFFNANYSIHYWIAQGLPPKKIVMGMPLYGQSFQLEKAENHGLNAKAPGPGQAGEYTRAAGFLAYYEICDRIKNRGWTVVQDPEHRMGPYAYKGNQWVSFDDADMIRRKSNYVKKMGLGGGMIWALDLDDFKNRCGEGVHPLLKTIADVLENDQEIEVENIEPKPPIEIPSVETQKPPPSSTKPFEEMKITRPSSTPSQIDNKKPSKSSDYKVVCYFTNWAWYRQGDGKFLPSDIDPDLCTHIIYGFAVLNGDELIIKPHDSWADFDNKFYAKVTALKSKGIKVLIAIGGWNDSAGDKYSRLVNNPSARRRFITHVINFIEENNFDGLDLDWEYPKCWQVDCKKGPDSDKPAFAEFVKELREAFNSKNLLLSAAVSPNKRVVDVGYDVPALSQNLDWIAVMAYDYHGQWDKKTGHVAPMYEHPNDTDPTFNTNFSINYWISQGADRKKIVLGMPLYGQSFSLADNNNHGLNAPTYGGGEAGRETRARGFLAYYEICENIIKKGWKVVRDRRGRMGPYAYLRDQWVSFDDWIMLEHKSQYIKAMGLGGGMVWALDLDDFRNICGCENYPLLKTINRVLRGYPGPQPMCMLEKTEELPDYTTPKKPGYTPTKKPQKPIPPVQTPSASPSEIEIVTKPAPSTYKPSISSILCDGRIFVEHDSDCNKYYLCNYGLLQEQKCAPGLYWNKDRCDWPENTKCQANTIPGSSDVENEVGITKPVYKPTTAPSITKPTTMSTTMKPTTRPRPTKPYPGTEVSSKYKIVCYFTNWAWYRQGDGKYTPDDIDPSLCTHIAYGFAVLDANSLTIKPHDSWADIDNKFYERVTAYKSKGIKVLIALGGWNDSLGNKYSKLVNNPAARARFIKKVLNFIEKWNFDGLDLDWEYPKCWQVDCKKGPDSDKEGFASLLAELSAEFKPKGLLLSAAVSPSKMVIDAGYDVPALNRYLDWISVMTYDFHGHWDKQTGHVAPLYYYPGDTYKYFNANFSLNYWIEKGASPSKVIMGLPFYGQSFSLADTKEHGLNAKTYGPGEAGEFTRAGGFLAFYEICERVKLRKWTVVRDPEGRIGPYAYKGNQWVSYDDISEIKRKTKLIRDLGLGGGMIWALDLDDFRNRCGCGTHPLLKTLNYELHKTPLSARNSQDCT